ncbi:MAG: hypothetical protein U0414_03020 [Polyangiaceae bacterium]
MSSDWSDLSLGEQETERAMERAASEREHKEFVASAPPADLAAEERAQQQRVDRFIQRWSIAPQAPEREGERREFVVRAAKLEIGAEAVERANRPKEELTPEQRAMQEQIASKLLFEFSREMATLATHLGVRLFEDGDDDRAFRHIERVFDVAAPTWMAERAKRGMQLLGGEAFGELFKKKDPRTYRLMTEGWSPVFLPATSMEARNVASSRPLTDEDKVIIAKRTPVRPKAGPLESDSTDEALIALEPDEKGNRHTTVNVVPPKQLAADAPAAPAPAAPAETRGETSRLVAVGVIAAVVVGGACVWWFGIRDQGANNRPAPTATVTQTTTQVVTVVKTVEVPVSAAAPVDTNGSAAPVATPSAPVSAPAVTTGAPVAPTVKSTSPSVGTTPTTPAPPASTTAAPSHSRTWGDK